jgi:hypothetical protein
MPFSPDTTLTDIKSAIGSVATNQITGISRVYVSNPDGPPENGSIVVGTPTFQVEDDTTAKLKVNLTFPCAYVVRRKDGREDVLNAESYFLPIILAYSSWANQDLTTNSYITRVEKGGIGQATYSGQVFRCLLFVVHVVAEFNIPVS